VPQRISNQTIYNTTQVGWSLVKKGEGELAFIFANSLALLLKIFIAWICLVQKTLFKNSGLQFHDSWHNSCLEWLSNMQQD
jgi:hypothetical protein